MRLILILLFGTASFLQAQPFKLFPDFIVKGDPYINALTQTSDGAYLLASRIDHVNGAYCSNLVKIDNKGNLDKTFSKVVVDYHITKIEELSDHKILVGGLFSQLNNVNASLVRLNADGTLDNSFQPFALDKLELSSFDTQSDGKIIIVGGFQKYGYNGLMRLNADGSIDNTFNVFTPPLGFLAGIVTDNSGNIYVHDTQEIYKLDSNGSTMIGFPASADGGYFFHFSLFNDKLLVAGNFSSFNGISRSNIALINSDGSLDPFNPTFPAANQLITISNSKIIINDQEENVSAYDSNGNKLSDLATSVSGNFFVDNFERLIISGGKNQRALNLSRPYLHRFNNDLTNDDTFQCEATYTGGIISIASQPDGKILIGGDYSLSSIGPNSKLARLNPDGTIDDSFKPQINSDSDIRSIDVLPDGKILVCSDKLIRLNKSGKIDNSLLFNKANLQLRKVRHAGDKIFLCGQFDNINNYSSPGIISLNSDGSAVQSFVSSLPNGSYATDFGFQSDEKIIIVGYFPFNDGASAVVRLNPDGTIDNSFLKGSSNSNGVSRVAVDSTGNVYVSGSFIDYNGATQDRFVRLLSNGDIDNSFQTAIPFESNSNVLFELLAKNKIVLGANVYYGSPALHAKNYSGSELNLDYTKLGSNSSVQASYFDGYTLYLSGRITSADQSDVSGISIVNIYPVYGSISEMKAARDGESVAHLTWTNTIKKGTLLIIERSVNNNQSYLPIDTVSSDASNYDDLTIDGQSSFYYRIRAINTSSTTDYFEEVVVPPGLTQTIDFATIQDEVIGDEPFDVSAITSSGLPVNFTKTSDNISMDGAHVTILKPGRVTIVASSPGGGEYLSAVPVSQSFCVRPAKPTISVSNLDLRPAILTSSAAAGNQWYLNEVLIENAIDQTYSASETGVYSLQVNVDDCLSDFSDGLGLQITGDIQNSNSGIIIYPNPASEWLYISLPAETLANIFIYSVDGRQVETFSAQTKLVSRNVANYARGVYYVEITSSGINSVIRFVKK